MPPEVSLPDGRGVVRLHWTAGRKRPAVAVVVDGAPVALEAIDLMAGAARERLVQHAPAELREAVRAALVTLALEPPPSSAASSTGPDGAPDALVRPVEAWPDPVVPADVMGAVLARLERHVHLPMHAAPVIAAWLTLTYCLEALPVAPLLWVRSPTRGCGKSTLLDLVTLLAARALKSENATLSALFRIAEKHRATLVLDELDQWLVGDRAAEIMGLLNAGFARGGRFLRSVGDAHEPTAFDVYGFRAVGGIGRTLHDTTRSRAYCITLERAPSSARLAPLQAMHAAAWADPLRQQLARLGEQLRDGMTARLADPDATAFPPHLDGRARDLWLPALALGAEIGEPFAGMLAAACEHLTRRAAREEGDVGVLLLLDVRRYFVEKDRQSVQPVKLLEWLHDQDGAPWSEFRAGKPLSSRGLADLLKRFDIASTPPQWHAGLKARWLHPAMFEDAWARYCPDAGTDAAPPEHNAFPSGEPSHVFFASHVSHDHGTDGPARTDGTLPQTETTSPHASPEAFFGPGLEALPEDYWETLTPEAA